ncbi:glycosyl hydrolase [Conexibacter sp. CPCC 206217]|uniref:glycosyl hydrolase n=1 Tax=Conexibacter sp. CPCC 206217 TaxID=3064574 RepID=UPI00271B7EEB|nr:glycosyl hydrolase [Conexibacter sp. CPCC 206217]MDO8211072.1 glycosyl hydrolase [Conexibacter sp. CPCC 206217]
MKQRFLALCFVVLGLGLASATSAQAFDTARFAQPRSDSRPSVLWFWNGTVTPQLIDDQLAELRAQGVDEVLVFPFDTANLRPKFFTEEWFALIGHTLREAQRTGMHLWLFNDDIFPSGRGAGIVVNGGRLGGRTYEPHPELRMQGAAAAGSTVVEGGRAIDVRQLLATGLSVSDGRLVVDASSRAGVTLLRDGADWQDYDLTTTVRIESGTAGTMVRSPDDRNGYLVDLASDGGIDVWRQVDGSFSLLHDGGTLAGFDPAAEHEVRVRLRGDELTASLDGDVVATVHDATFPRGRVGVRAVATQRSLRDDLRVTAADGSTLLDERFDDESALGRFQLDAPVDRLAALAARPADGPRANDPSAVVDLTDLARDGRSWNAPVGRWRIDTFLVQRLIDDSNFRRYYLDTLDEEAVGRFLDVVVGEYHRRFPWAFGTVLRGFADDEPFIPSADAHFNATPWSPTMERALRKHGTSPAQALSALQSGSGFGRDGQRVQGRFWRTVSDRFTEAYYKQQHRYMEDLGVSYISNPLWDEYGPAEQIRSTGNLNAASQWAQIPGTDVVFDHFQRGYQRLLPRWAASAAHQLGLPRVYNESMGAFGWQVTPGDTRDVAGAFAARGVNFTLLHAAFSDQSNIFYPPPYNGANPWWRLTRPLNDWIGRVMELGRNEAFAPTALLQPQRAAEAGQGTPDADAIDSAFTLTAHALEDEQVDFDLLDEGALTDDPVLRAHAVVRRGALEVGRMRYGAVVLPQTPQLSLEAARTLERFVRDGGTLIAAGPLPQQEVDGRDAELGRVWGRLASASGGRGDDRGRGDDERRGGGDAGRGALVQLGDASGAGKAAADRGYAAATLAPASDSVRVLRLRDGRRTGFMVVNEGRTTVTTSARFALRGAPTLWDPATGAVTPATTYRDDADGTEIPLSLEPHEVIGVTFDTTRAGDDRRAQVARRGGHGGHGESGKGDPHAVAVSPGATVERIDAGRRGPQATVVATRPGSLTVVARDDARAYRGGTTVTDPLTPIAIGGDWQLQIPTSVPIAANRPLGSWTDLAASYSGSATYTRSLQLTRAQLAGREWTLDLGDVRTAAEVTINGRPLSQPLLWAPFVADVGDLLRTGTNTIVVRVTNTGANGHGDARASGLLGPVRLLPQRRLTVPLERTDDATLELRPATDALGVAPGQQRTLRVAVRDLTGGSDHVRLTADVSAPLQLRDRSVDVRLDREGRGTAELTLSAPLGASVPSTGELRLRASVSGGGGHGHDGRGASRDGDTTTTATVPVSVDLASRLGRAQASSTTSPWDARFLIDGVTRVDHAAWNRGEAWNDGTAGVFPDTVTVAFGDAAPVSRVRVWTLDTPEDPAAVFGVRDFDVQLQVDGVWRTVGQVRGNRAALAELSFPRVNASGLRVVVSAAPESYSRLVELEALP